MRTPHTLTGLKDVIDPHSLSTIGKFEDPDVSVTIDVQQAKTTIIDRELLWVLSEYEYNARKDLQDFLKDDYNQAAYVRHELRRRKQSYEQCELSVEKALATVQQVSSSIRSPVSWILSQIKMKPIHKALDVPKEINIESYLSYFKDEYKSKLMTGLTLARTFSYFELFYKRCEFDYMSANLETSEATACILKCCMKDITILHLQILNSRQRIACLYQKIYDILVDEH